MSKLIKVFMFATVFAAAIALAGCGQNASTVNSDTAQSMVNHLTYFKDSRTQVCYAVVASRGDFEAHQNGLTITYVPCTPQVEAEIVNH